MVNLGVLVVVLGVTVIDIGVCCSSFHIDFHFHTPLLYPDLPLLKKMKKNYKSFSSYYWSEILRSEILAVGENCGRKYQRILIWSKNIYKPVFGGYHAICQIFVL